MAEIHHITRICNTRSDLQANLDACQIAIESDNEENFIYKDDGGNYHIVANQSEDVTLLDVDCDTLTISTGNNLIITDLTEGSILFAGSSSEISEDNDNLFWDNSYKYLGICTSSPLCPLHIMYGSSGFDGSLSGTAMCIEGFYTAKLQFLDETDAEMSIHFGIATQVMHGRILYRSDVDNGRMRISVNNDAFGMTLTSSGLRIGSSAATSTLHVEGSGYQSYFSQTGSAVNAEPIMINQDHDDYAMFKLTGYYGSAKTLDTGADTTPTFGIRANFWTGEGYAAGWILCSLD